MARCFRKWFNWLAELSRFDNPESVADEGRRHGVERENDRQRLEAPTQDQRESASHFEQRHQRCHHFASRQSDRYEIRDRRQPMMCAR